MLNIILINQLFIVVNDALVPLSKPSVNTLSHHSMSSPAVLAAKAVLATIDLSHYDATQSQLMDERCILVDESDKAIGAMDKKTCMCSSLAYI